MNQIIDKQHCYGCGACSSKCPVQAIEMKADSEGFLNPIINKDRCIDCNQCRKVCPGYMKKNKRYVASFAAYSKNKEAHLKSSSGGIFYEIAKKVIQNKGVVYGAAYTDSNSVRHRRVSALEDLPMLQGSKYVQSEIGKTFLQVKNDLELGNQVLFSGTPCQIAGLTGFLNREYENLLTIDLICHGVPSQKILNKYLSQLFDGKLKVTSINFRDKELGISNSRLSFHFSDSDPRYQNYSDSEYIRGFLNNLYLRPSCYNCKFKSLNHFSDITIGDFWSVNEYHPSLSSSQGVSAVVINTRKGLAAFNNNLDAFKFAESDLEKVKTWNSNFDQPASMNQKRSEFFDGIEQQKFKTLVQKLTEDRYEYSGSNRWEFIRRFFKWLAS